MYSICFTSNRDHAYTQIDTFIDYILSMNWGTIQRVRRIPTYDGCSLFVHYSWFGNNELKKELDEHKPKLFRVGSRDALCFTMVKTSIPHDMYSSGPVDLTSKSKQDCMIL